MAQCNRCRHERLEHREYYPYQCGIYGCSCRQYEEEDTSSLIEDAVIPLTTTFDSGTLSIDTPSIPDTPSTDFGGFSGGESGGGGASGDF